MKASDGNGRHVADLSVATSVGTQYNVEWVPVPDRDARTKPIRQQFADADVTRARKLEGAWWDARRRLRRLQLRPRGEPPWRTTVRCGSTTRGTSTLTLRLLFGRNATPAVDGAFDGPDNIIVSPHGGVIIAEDGEGVQHLVGATHRRRHVPGGPQRLHGHSQGRASSPGRSTRPDGTILFANIQEPGYMFAITGPWRAQR